MVKIKKFLLDLGSAKISKQGTKSIISDKWGNSYELNPISGEEPLLDAQAKMIRGKPIVWFENRPDGNAAVYKVQDDSGGFIAIKEVTAAHCRKDVPKMGEIGGSTGTVDWKPLSLPDREYRAWQCIKAAGKTDHPNLVKYFGPPEKENDAIYLEREWAEGESLESLIGNRALTKLQLVDVIGQVLDAVSCLHSVGVIHRDVKPTNIIVKMENGEIRGVKLIDLGGASFIGFREKRDPMTRMTTCIFSEGFASMDAMATPCRQSDVFSVGATLLFGLTGKDAYDIYDTTRAVYRIPEEVDGPLRKVLEHSLLAATEKRYRTCEEMKESLRRAVEVEIRNNKELKLEKANRSLAKLESSEVGKSILRTADKLPDSGEILSIAKPNALYLIPHTWFIFGGIIALGIANAIIKGLIQGTYHLVYRPIHALRMLPNKLRVKSLKKAVERERARLNSNQEPPLLTAGDGLEKKNE